MEGIHSIKDLLIQTCHTCEQGFENDDVCWTYLHDEGSSRSAAHGGKETREKVDITVNKKCWSWHTGNTITLPSSSQCHRQSASHHSGCLHHALLPEALCDSPLRNSLLSPRNESVSPQPSIWDPSLNYQQQLVHEESLQQLNQNHRGSSLHSSSTLQLWGSAEINL